MLWIEIGGGGGRVGRRGSRQRDRSAGKSACCKTARHAGTPGWKEASDASPTTLLQEDDSVVRLVLPACLPRASLRTCLTRLAGLADW